VAPLTTAPAADWRLAVVLAVLTATAVLVSRMARLGVAREQLTAAVRAIVQLAAVSTLITVVLASAGWSLGFVLLMFVVATATSTRRIGVPLGQAALVGLAIGTGAGPVVALCLGSGVVPFSGAGIIPIAGIVIGGSMTAATLSGRRAFQELAAQTGTYEAGLALGLPAAEAIQLVVQPTSREALTPGIDQTRTVGLVTLPGAFVGVLLGGGTAVEAGAAQVLVLVGLLAAQSITAAVLLGLVARGRLVRMDLRSLAR
jgi:putative ABC transport system permease protein